MIVLSKVNVQKWSQLAVEQQIKKKGKLVDLQQEQVRSVFLYIQAFPHMREELIKNPKFILTDIFQSSVDKLTGSTKTSVVRLSTPGNPNPNSNQNKIEKENENENENENKNKNENKNEVNDEKEGENETRYQSEGSITNENAFNEPGMEMQSYVIPQPQVIFETKKEPLSPNSKSSATAPAMATTTARESKMASRVSMEIKAHDNNENIIIPSELQVEGDTVIVYQS